MNLFDVYSQYKINFKAGKGLTLTAADGKEYLDFYGGHGVISIGHCHPYYTEKITNQLNTLAFYTNVIQNDIQEELARKLGKISGYNDYNLFLCNSGAEAVENALKIASFHTGKKRILALKGAFHGRTSGALAVTDNESLRSEYNVAHEVTFIELNDVQVLEEELGKEDVAALIIEGIQGVGGVYEPSVEYLQLARNLCTNYNTALILDEIQAGYGRTGKFFAHQYADIKADIITTAKGMGNGFPVAGVLIAPHFEAKKGMLGTTYGGNYLACTAALAVLDVIENENLLENAQRVGDYLFMELKAQDFVKEVRGKGLMIGIEMENAKEMRTKLLMDGKIFTGFSAPATIRLLPPLNITLNDAKRFIQVFNSIHENVSI
ncbi:MAG: aspartate aminotransferase family protein [Bacteroidales bacterium]|nr:aspartate aminotransferase family protein [Bacteroidales bacterium]